MPMSPWGQPMFPLDPRKIDDAGSGPPRVSTTGGLPFQVTRNRSKDSARSGPHGLASYRRAATAILTRFTLVDMMNVVFRGLLGERDQVALETPLKGDFSLLEQCGQYVPANAGGMAKGRTRDELIGQAGRDPLMSHYVQGVFDKATERSGDLDGLREQNRRFDAAIEGMSHGLCMVDADERMIVCNAHYLEMFGLDPAVIRPGIPFVDILRHSVEVGVASQGLEELYAVRQQIIAAGRIVTYHEELSDGRVVAISHRPMPMPQDGSEARYAHGGWVSIYEDVTRQRRAEDALREQNRRFDAALSNMGQGLCMFDADARLLVHNERCLELFGVSPGVIRVGDTYCEIVGRLAALGCYAETASADAICESTRAQVTAMASGGGPQPPLLRELSDGRAVSASHRPMVGGGWVTTFEDVTERRRSEAQIAHMARHDGLTNLPNRTTFHERVAETVTLVGHSGIAAVFYIDLDRFKMINDSLGHLAGDHLLRIVAERLQGCVRDTDTVARLGGDEFAVLQIAMAEPIDASILADRLLRAIGEPLELNGQRIKPGMSIGIAIAPVDGTEIDELMKSADLALYRAKANGGDTYRFFEPEMDARLQAGQLRDIDPLDQSIVEAP
ncbi:MAG TPA: PAS-domain containing protein [Lichenihabitans sp.]|jgi:diguanylate cyclase (GGDEF)-like protein|nr:PAS-domain containing protein [Lichenihabitans sp.]